MTTLTELAAKCVASYIPFELVEHVFPPVPEQLQLRIAFWSFPDNEEDIRLYSCLANSSSDEFHRGDQLYKNRLVKEPLQIGKSLQSTADSELFSNDFHYFFSLNSLVRFSSVGNGDWYAATHTVQCSGYIRS